MDKMKYPNLEWAFKDNNRGFLSILYDTHVENPYYLSRLNALMSFLQVNKCKNIQNKLKHIVDLWNFQSILSELEMAELLIKQGKQVDILPDDFDKMISPPDLHVTDDFFDVYIEVTRITDDQTIDILTSGLTKIINEKKIPFAIDLDINDQVSVPAFYNERDIKREKLMLGLKELDDYYDSTQKRDSEIIPTSIGNFKLRETRLGKGYSGNITWGSGIPYEKTIKKIRRDVIFKAQKREKWTGDHLKKYFIVALVFEDITHDPMYLESALFGSMTFVDLDGNRMIKKAIERGWSEYLLKMNIDTTYQFLDPNKRGIYFRSLDVTNVSGVIGKFMGRDTVFYPNPFAKEEIGNPTLTNFIK